MRMDWNAYFKEHKYPCFITHKDTQEILYYNDEFKKTLELNENKVGKKFFELVDKEEVHILDNSINWDEMDYFETESYNKRLHRKFNLKSTKMLDGTSIFCEMIPLENSLYDNVVFEKAAAKCMDLFEGPKEKIYPKLMRLLTEFYNADRAYIYRFDVNDNTINCVAQWCESEEFRVTQEIGTRMDAKLFMEWLQSKNDAGIVSASITDDAEHSGVEKEVLEKFKLNNLTICNVEDGNHQVVGLVGISNRQDENQYFDRRLMHTVSRLVAQDVAKEKLEADMLEKHLRDDLTGVYNRMGYSKRIDTILSKKPRSIGVISVNINGLKNINERDGIEQGDLHIKKSTKRFEEYFGYEFFRMSGDEFIGITWDVEEDVFEEKAMNLYMKLKEEKNYDFSFGHAWGTGNMNVMTLTNEADMLMYINKQQYYSEGKKVFDSLKDTCLTELLTHLENEEFMIYLQPQVWLKDGSLYGAEALIRLYDKTKQKMIFPDQFISKYEDNSVIRHLDMFVLEEVCKLQKQWISQGKEIPISVNFSRITLQEYGIVQSISEVCEKYQVPHHLVVIEITERVGLINNSVASMLVKQFKEKGFHLSLDDFGCAYSNIVTLAQIEVDEVKIDKSLVDFILTNKKNRVLVKSILSMCNELDGTATLAEGIEEEGQGALLHELGCGLGQGYHYSRPISVGDFNEKYIEKQEKHKLKILTVEADIKNLDVVHQFVIDSIKEYQYSDQVRFQLELAVEEIYVNIAHHAYPNAVGSTSLKTEILTDEKGEYLVLEIMDYGTPYNPLEEEDPNLELSATDRKIGGLGIYMIKNSMDELEYRFENENNIFTVKKYLSE